MNKISQEFTVWNLSEITISSNELRKTITADAATGILGLLLVHLKASLRV